ncbi:hypothetical protein IJH24_03495 [Candidatus Saccharibacteria bacterium]|nr:hypothetical protein [Candidatus Saccharibacteria bacterium]
MSWQDKPTKAQINVLWRWFKWKMPTAEARDALTWLEENATKRQVFDEIGRVKKMYDTEKLTREDCFSGSIWQGYFNSKVGKE